VQQDYKEDTQFKFQLYEMALMDLYGSYMDILTAFDDDRYEQVLVLREAKKKLDLGKLVIKKPNSDKELQINILYKYHQFEAG
jgi:hypothetical protein